MKRMALPARTNASWSDWTFALRAALSRAEIIRGQLAQRAGQGWSLVVRVEAAAEADLLVGVGVVPRLVAIREIVNACVRRECALIANEWKRFGGQCQAKAVGFLTIGDAFVLCVVIEQRLRAEMSDRCFICDV